MRKTYGILSIATRHPQWFRKLIAKDPWFFQRKLGEE